MVTEYPETIYGQIINPSMMNMRIHSSDRRVYNILSLDGGGIRGIMVAKILARVEAERPGTMESFDMFAGTSTGSILAIAFAAGMTPADVVQLYTSLATNVFADTVWDDIKDLYMAFGAQYGNGAIIGEVKRMFGERTLDTLKPVLIGTFDLNDEERGMWKPKFFHNFPGDDSDGEEKVYDVIARSTAAPVFFPSYGNYIDGGVVVNNPSVCAIAQVLKQSSFTVSHEMYSTNSLENIRLLSMGTGRNPMRIEETDVDWGVVQWIPELLYIMMDGGVGIADYQCRQFLGDNYFRVNPKLKRSIPLDGIEYIGDLIRIANNIDLTELLKWIDRS